MFGPDADEQTTATVEDRIRHAYATLMPRPGGWVSLTRLRTELPRDERDRIYAIIVQRAPGFAEYEERTDRVIPVLELAPEG
jgi:hypothetical protein